MEPAYNASRRQPPPRIFHWSQNTRHFNAIASVDDIEVVIMDEIIHMHYLGDKECCHVWEQLLLMLPQSVTLVSLSGTMPNVVELEDWLSRSRGKTEIQVCQTLKRLVPLQHYFYTGRNKQTSSNFYLIVKKEVKCGWIGVDDGGIDFDVNPGLVEATYSWARGNPLSVVAGQSGADEGHLLWSLQASL
ncbi:unnamed protein product [Mesocestoides corti]|uniref:Helicase ATP-binding domain-containing protein n=1 Tax=Mesocestoides corti TaxID=53468 RepID=A0A0R3U713_MESCO|nr:unnamed protein product [Mesocestoides corti]